MTAPIARSIHAALADPEVKTIAQRAVDLSVVKSARNRQRSPKSAAIRSINRASSSRQRLKTRIAASTTSKQWPLTRSIAYSADVLSDVLPLVGGASRGRRWRCAARRSRRARRSRTGHGLASALEALSARSSMLCILTGQAARRCQLNRARSGSPALPDGTRRDLCTSGASAFPAILLFSGALASAVGAAASGELFLCGLPQLHQKARARLRTILAPPVGMTAAAGLLANFRVRPRAACEHARLVVAGRRARAPGAFCICPARAGTCRSAFPASRSCVNSLFGGCSTIAASAGARRVPSEKTVYKMPHRWSG